MPAFGRPIPPLSGGSMRTAIHNGCNADTHLLASALVGKVALR